MKWNYKNLVRWLNPSTKVAGLEITDAAVKLVWLNEKGEIVNQFSQPLPAGTVQGGKVVNQAQLLAALQQLKPAAVILSLSSVNVYTQVFNLPYLEGEKLEEAARLNLKMLSPLDFRTAYSDWQVLGTVANGLEVLAAFVNAAAVDDFNKVLKSAGFLPVAAEFYSLSLVRALTHLSSIDLTKSYLVLSLTGDGMNFAIMRAGQLYFNYFISWQAVQEKAGGGQVTFADFQKVMLTELQRLLNFSSSRWGTAIKDLLLVSVSPTKAVVEGIKKEFNLNIQEVANAEWLAVMGVAWRGLVPRMDDRFISLTSVGTEEEFARQRTRSFVNLWRNVVFGTLVIIFLIFLFSDLIFVRQNRALEAQLRTAQQGIDQEEINQLEAEAKEFNALVAKAVVAKKLDSDWSAAFRKVYLLAGAEIILKQLRLEPKTAVISLVGEAANERAAIGFKNRLAKEEDFSNLSFPLAAIKIEANGRAGFSATFAVGK